MSYRIEIYEISAPEGEAENVRALERRIYEQHVDTIDLRAVMAAVNQRPRKSRSKGAKEEK